MTLGGLIGEVRGGMWGLWRNGSLFSGNKVASGVILSREYGFINSFISILLIIYRGNTVLWKL